MKELRYKLTLEVDDWGERSFSASCVADNQDDLNKRMVFDLGRMMKIMNNPPAIQELVQSMGDGSMANLGFIVEHYWDGENDIDNALSISIDLDVLMPSADDEEIIKAKAWAKSFGFQVKSER